MTRARVVQQGRDLNGMGDGLRSVGIAALVGTGAARKVLSARMPTRCRPVVSPRSP
ncbi:MAG TPA: hypothetical protein VGN29_15410 [Solirubrobacteraceae bacterium]|nr:hypothetical protein [Solirubrobacteraceae bacterium]